MVIEKCNCNHTYYYIQCNISLHSYKGIRYRKIYSPMHYIRLFVHYRLYIMHSRWQTLLSLKWSSDAIFSFGRWARLEPLIRAEASVNNDMRYVILSKAKGITSDQTTDMPLPQWHLSWCTLVLSRWIGNNFMFSSYRIPLDRPDHITLYYIVSYYIICIISSPVDKYSCGIN